MKTMMPNDKTVHIDCDCHAPEHMMRVTTYDWGGDLPPEIEFSIQAHQWKPLYKRFWPALKYIFGAELVWDSVCLSDEREIVKLRQALSTYDAKYVVFEKALEKFRAENKKKLDDLNKKK